MHSQHLQKPQCILRIGTVVKRQMWIHFLPSWEFFFVAEDFDKSWARRVRTTYVSGAIRLYGLMGTMCFGMCSMIDLEISIHLLLHCVVFGHAPLLLLDPLVLILTGVASLYSWTFVFFNWWDRLLVFPLLLSQHGSKPWFMLKFAPCWIVWNWTSSK